MNKYSKIATIENGIFKRISSESVKKRGKFLDFARKERQNLPAVFIILIFITNEFYFIHTPLSALLRVNKLQNLCAE